jgi:hypothetical protein
MIVASPAFRWSILALLLAATLVGVFYPLEQSDGRRPSRTPSPATQVAASADGAANPTAIEQRANVDPFAPRSWQAQPMVAPTVAEVVVPEFVGPLRPPPPPPAPALPYQYMGRFTADGPSVVYLSRGEQTLIARSGETLESVYKILDISPLKIDFLHVPTGEKQSLPIPAPSN